MATNEVKQVDRKPLGKALATVFLPPTALLVAASLYLYCIDQLALALRSLVTGLVIVGSMWGFFWLVCSGALVKR
jgi:hypothetical protein